MMRRQNENVWKPTLVDDWIENNITNNYNKINDHQWEGKRKRENNATIKT